MNHRALVLEVLIISFISTVSCVAGPTPTSPSPTLLPNPVRSQTPTAIITVTFPTRVAAPIVTLAPDFFASRIKVEMANFRFSPSSLRTRVGQPIRLELQNTDVLRHNFAIDNSDIEAQALPGFSQKLDFVFSKPGTFTFACNIVDEGDHRSAGMIGTLTVEPAP